MSVVTIERSQDAGRTDRYISDDPAHDGSGKRVWYESAIGTTPDRFLEDMRHTRSMMAKERLAVETYHVVQSFTAGEYNPDDLDAGYNVHQLGYATAKQAFPGHQVKISTQKDGESGLWHNHIQIANVSHVSADVTMFNRDGESWVEHREAGKPASTGLANIYRIRAVNDEVAREAAGYDNKALVADHSKDSWRDTAADRDKQAAGKYNWRDDIRERIVAARDSSLTITSMIAELNKVGVEVRERGKAKNLSFSFVDDEGKQRPVRGSKLGAMFTREQLVNAIDERLFTASVTPQQQIPQPAKTTTPQPVRTAPDVADDFPTPSSRARKAPRKPAESEVDRTPDKPPVEPPAPPVAVPAPVRQPQESAFEKAWREMEERQDGYRKQRQEQQGFSL